MRGETRTTRHSRRWVGWLTLGMIGALVGLLLVDAPAPRDETQLGGPGTSVAGPIGAEAYAARLRAAAGMPLTPERLEALASDAAETLTARMTAVAGQLSDSEDWRRVVSELLADHPADAAGVLDLYRSEVARAETFVRRSNLFPLPDSDTVEVVEIHNPHFRRFFSLAMYLDGRLAVTASSNDGDDERYLRNHCRTCVPPLAVHETWPGHHVAFAFVGDDAGRPTEVDKVVFHEGWGLYVEQLMLDLGYYDDPARELGALRLLYLRVLRAQIDPALHAGRLEPSDAEAIYRRDGLLTAAAARAEVARHLEDPVLKASYFVGLRQILALRRITGVDSDDVEALADFHRRFLGRPRPIPDVALERFGVVLDVTALDVTALDAASASDAPRDRPLSP